jgi:hypothetical protein
MAVLPCANIPPTETSVIAGFPLSVTVAALAQKGEIKIKRKQIIRGIIWPILTNKADQVNLIGLIISFWNAFKTKQASDADTLRRLKSGDDLEDLKQF